MGCVIVSCADLEKLLAVHRENPPVLSLYLQVPVNVPLRGLPARAGELLTAAASGMGSRDVGLIYCGGNLSIGTMIGLDRTPSMLRPRRSDRLHRPLCRVGAGRLGRPRLPGTGPPAAGVNCHGLRPRCLRGGHLPGHGHIGIGDARTPSRQPPLRNVRGSNAPESDQVCLRGAGQRRSCDSAAW